MAETLLLLRVWVIVRVAGILPLAALKRRDADTIVASIKVRNNKGSSNY